MEWNGSMMKRNLKNGAKEAVFDLVQPWNGGWGRLFDSISTARKEAVPIGEKYLGLESFFDPKLLAGRFSYIFGVEECIDNSNIAELLDAFKQLLP